LLKSTTSIGEKADTPSHMYTCVMEGLDLFNAKGITFSRQTVLRFIFAGLCVGKLGEAVDVLLDREKRLYFYIRQCVAHDVLFK
jgi:hypothetical protein